jgi:hypothetical protein
MANQATSLDFWSLKAVQLAKECRQIAQSDSPKIDESLRAEANLLAAEFRDALLMPQDEFQDEARRAAQLAALRKRAIEILVKVSPDK